MFACPKGTKEHESVVALNCKSQFIHAALLAVARKPGHPVQWDPTYRPASGTTIEIQVLWTDEDGQRQKARAQEWVRSAETGKAMQYPWVFAGSAVFTDETTGQRYYQADGGDLICVSNFPSATLDLPVESSQENNSLMYTAFTDNIPPVGTKVRLILIPKLSKTAPPNSSPKTPNPKPPIPGIPRPPLQTLRILRGDTTTLLPRHREGQLRGPVAKASCEGQLRRPTAKANCEGLRASPLLDRESMHRLLVERLTRLEDRRRELGLVRRIREMLGLQTEAFVLLVPAVDRFAIQEIAAVELQPRLRREDLHHASRDGILDFGRQHHLARLVP